MSDHKTAFVPLATGYFQSPKLLSEGIIADIGLFAEALLYYDSVCIHVENPQQFGQLIGLLFRRGLSYKNLISLIKEDTLKFAFTSWVMPYMGTGDPQVITSLYLMRDNSMSDTDRLTQTFIKNDYVKKSFFSSLDFNEFGKAAENAVINLSGDEVGNGVIDDAFIDLKQADRYKLITKNLLIEHYHLNNLGDPPEFDVKISEIDPDDVYKIEDKAKSTFLGDNSDEENYKMYRIEHSEAINSIPSLEDKNKAATFSHSPIVCAGLSNLYIRAAETLDSDLYLSKPISRIVGNKLFESANAELNRLGLEVQDVVETLKIKVDFPDVREDVNSNLIRLNQIIEIREKAPDFRKWIQNDDRSKDEIVNIHTEATSKFNLRGASRKEFFELFGAFHRDLFSITDDKVIINPSDNFVESVGQQLLGKWRPLTIGTWLKEEISKVKQINKKKEK